MLDNKEDVIDYVEWHKRRDQMADEVRLKDTAELFKEIMKALEEIKQLIKDR